MPNSNNNFCDSTCSVYAAEDEVSASRYISTLANIAWQRVLLHVGNSGQEVVDAFNRDQKLIGIIIIGQADDQMLGMISRKRFMELYSKPFRRELYTKKPLTLLIEKDFNNPLCLNETDKIDYAVRTALARSTDLIYEPIVVRDEQGFFKLIDTHLLLLELARAHERQSIELHESLSRVRQLNVQLDESQERIMESINYAKVIQESILPRKELFNRLFSEWFILYRPRDIVGGDMYWLREINELVLLAVIDCTGHGVPGAFMTMTVNSVLNHIVDRICHDDPSNIMAEMHRILQETLHLRCEKDSIVDAGLDIALCCINTRQQTLTYSGAGLSLFLFEDDNMIEIKGGRAGIGYRGGGRLDHQYPNHTRPVRSGMVIYVSTDGFMDESGGTKGFGFGRKRFGHMVAQHAQRPLESQQKHFEQTLAEWRGERNQRDDITLVGFRL